MVANNARNSAANAARNGGSGATGNPIMHRLQIGIAGIFAVLVMVALADMLLQRASGEAATNIAATAPDTSDAAAPPVVQAPAASEPLVDLGVVPDLPSEGAQHSAGGQTPVVGELQPDPRSGTGPVPQQ
ncbi:hypothetical protein [Blastomonas sp.]|uniref:hypothetical protein n=1 Tax=Blastomonas sp. TaxID=1909299 RepID=UPI003918CC0F